jgi:hypothetical protein
MYLEKIEYKTGYIRGLFFYSANLTPEIKCLSAMLNGA